MTNCHQLPGYNGDANKSSTVAEMGDRLATIDIGRKKGAAVPLFGGSCTPSNTMWPGSRSTSVPSGILIHSAVWSQHGPKIEGAVPLWGGELGPHLTQCRLRRRLPPYIKWHLYPSSRLATADMGRKFGGAYFGRSSWVPI